MMTDDKFVSEYLSDEHLSSADEKEGEFVGATLSLKPTNSGYIGVHTYHGSTNDVTDGHPFIRNEQHTPTPIDNQAMATDPNLNRSRPGSTYSRRSTLSTSSRTSKKQNIVRTDEACDLFFSYKDNSFDTAVRKCSEHIQREADGQFQGAWILTEVDHWNNELEKLVILTDDSLLIFKYNFITQKVLLYKRIFLHCIDTVKMGDFVYPNFSVMPNRSHGGIQVCWNKGQIPPISQVWNPFSNDIPWAIFCHHPLIYNPKESETAYFNVDDFMDTLADCLNKCYNRKRPNENATIVEGAILLKNYVNLPSVFFNSNSLGFSRDRNGFCF
ncbi:tumor protein p63-regulated gene 1-like protein [Octopus sinensis]|uniref:Tumor protein p63-regulated gene 1-like protein n=1 Tax=Octopus sinensis TaxID=2607531 RepID=A0A6P7SYR4_9MOLL|nr:tumor protein p63-regulated gene 1-like protein [Octopus sinensis]